MIRDFLVAWEFPITQIAPLMKHSTFSSERECRLSKWCTQDELLKLEFRQKATMLSKHLPLRPAPTVDMSNYRLPISSLTVGPCRHQAVSYDSACLLFRKHGYDQNSVNYSQIPFQAT